MSVRVEEISELVCLQLGVGRARPADRLLEDLAADSADLLNLVVAVEDRYGIAIDEEDLTELRTVDDLYRLTLRRLAE